MEGGGAGHGARAAASGGTREGQGRRRGAQGLRLVPDCCLDGQEATPPQTPRTGHFITAEECLKLFPRRLKEHFQVTQALRRLSRPGTQPQPCGPGAQSRPGGVGSLTGS